jgi:pantetheine-phosphate adenylyltransferase
VKVGLFPGSFDPFHNGHLEIVERASRLFDEVVVAALRNPQKGLALFDLQERQTMLEEVTAHLPSVRIVSVATLLVYVARDVGASAIVRGLRAVSDFEAEMQMAQMNSHPSSCARCGASGVTSRPSCPSPWPRRCRPSTNSGARS